jgi:HEAT repeat protein
MNKRPRTVLLLVVAGLGLLILGVAAFWPFAGFNAGSEPTFDGKPSSRWRADLRAELTNQNKLAQPVSHALQQGNADEAVPVLIDLLDDDDVRVRRAATFLLRGHFTRTPGPEAGPAIDPLTARLRDDDPTVRRWAVGALGYLGPRACAAAPGIARLLKDSDEAVVVESAMALGNMGPGAQVALPALREASQDPRPVVQKSAALALKKLAPAK